MANLNRVMLIGNLVADPEVRYTPKGTAVTDLRLAVNRQWSGEGGQRQEETTYLDVTLWSRQAEVAGQYLSKGRPVFIEGRLQMETWEDKTSGQKRSKLKIVGENMQFLGSGNNGGGGAGGGGGNRSGGSAPQQSDPAPQQSDPAPQQSDPAPQQPQQQAPQGGSAAAEMPSDTDDDIPF